MPVDRLRETLSRHAPQGPPRVADAPYEDALEWFLKNAAGRKGDLLLHGADDVAGKGRYSIAATAPSFILSVKLGQAILRTQEDMQHFSVSPLETLSLLDGFMAHVPPITPFGHFCGGLVLLLPYELGRYFEPGRAVAKPPVCADLWCAFYPRVMVFDNQLQKAFEVSWDGGQAERPAAPPERSFTLSPFACDEPREAYIAKVETAKRYIEAGDVYQVNLSRRLKAAFTGDPLGLFAGLCAVNPASFGAYLDGGDFHLLSLSPELFFNVREGVITTCPIKGTAPRGADAMADREEMARLAASEKNRAENLMIVDLMRSDLGKVCVPGSVAVASLFACESLPNVHQLVSTVRGRLLPGAGMSRILSALYPGGSVTGAPKVRAMEIIAGLETTARGAYCGSLAAWGLDGGITASLLIRTLYLEKGRAVYRAGGGIVADSDPQGEYEETAHKAAMLEAMSAKSVRSIQ